MANTSSGLPGYRPIKAEEIMVKASQLAMPGLFAVPNQISGLQEKKLKGTLFFFVYTPTNRLVSVMLLCLRRSAFD